MSDYSHFPSNISTWKKNKIKKQLEDEKLEFSTPLLITGGVVTLWFTIGCIHAVFPDSFNVIQFIINLFK